MSGTANVYRMYGADGALLYIGVSLSVFYRVDQHRQAKEWFGEVATIKIEHFATRKEAFTAEYAAIRTERPKYNRTPADPNDVRKNGWREPGDVEIAEMLLARGAALSELPGFLDLPDHWVRDQVLKATGTAARRPVET